MVQGIDISHNNAVPANFAGLSPDIKFIWMKATEGPTFKDPQFQNYWTFCKQNNIIHGAYHFLRVDASAQSQVNNYLSRGVDWSLPGVLPPMLDIEDQVGATDAETKALNGAILKDKQGWIDKITIWLEAVELKTGRKPVIYSYKNFFRDYMNNTPKFGDKLLWLAAYQAEPPQLPIGWKAWTFWQFSERGSIKGPQTGGDMDWNYFNGTTDQLSVLANIKPTT